ncbi:hypothetical protein QH494_08250 [Sphingomonas sp. AR_OL41]|uniref:hypothetical protein n=1 Tax=Sphingomonas sp. AR_OL41 TaxID=3042729 RepID=UPI00247FECCB|nr:hypothetical protein [Sphingomonas sp. AR_OL41]MDH7972175.1 hypothetical protein [Sphingomonas sp. AR_OL41]
MRSTSPAAAVALAIVGAVLGLGMALAPARQGPPAEHGAAISLNIAGVALSAHVSFH